MVPNQTVSYPASGFCARNMQATPVTLLSNAPFPQGGGDLNGTQAEPIFFSHAGTGLGQRGLPRLPCGATSFTS